MSPVLYPTSPPSPRPCCSVRVLCRQQFTLTPFSLSLPDRPSAPPSATPSRLVFSLPLLISCIMLWLLVLVLGCRVEVAHAPPQRRPRSGSRRLFVGRLTFLSLAICALRAALRHGAFVCVTTFDVLRPKAPPLCPPLLHAPQSRIFCVLPVSPKDFRLHLCTRTPQQLRAVVPLHQAPASAKGRPPPF